MQPSWGPRIFWSSVFLLIIAGVFAWFYEPSSNPEFDQVRENIFHESPVTISQQLLGCELQIGRGDLEPAHWKGEIRLTKGKLLQIIPVQSGKGTAIQGDQFEVSSVLAGQQTSPAVLRCAFIPDVSDSLTVVLGNEKKTIAISELPNKDSLDLFEGKVKLSRAPPIQVLHQSEDDTISPKLTNDQQGNLHLIYLNCERRQLLDAAAILSGNFDTLQRSSGGVSVRLSHFQKGTWSGAEDVTGVLDAVSEAVVAADQNGRIFVAWSQPGSDGFDVYYRMKAPSTQGNADNPWSEPKKVTEHSASVRDLIATTDAKGKVWLAWQTWHYNHYDIYASVINDETHAWHTPGPVADHDRDSEGRWYPAVASDTLGNTFIAWTVFRQGRFDVELVKLAASAVKTQPLLIASGLATTAKPSLACDAQNQIWVAYEDSGEIQSHASESNRAGIVPSITHPDKIHIRVVDSQQQISDWPAVSLPKDKEIGGQGSGVSSPLDAPHLLMLQGNVPLVAYTHQSKLFYTLPVQQGWSEPEELAFSDNGCALRTALVHQADCVAAYTQAQDELGRSRIYVTAQPLSKVPSTESLALSKGPAPSAQQKGLDSDWKRFQENIRLFRGRPQDPELANKHLLRGLVFLEPGVKGSPPSLAAPLGLAGP